MNRAPKRQPLSVRDFRARIAGIMRGNGQSGSDEDETIELRKTGSSIVRLPTDRGYYPPSQERPR